MTTNNRHSVSVAAVVLDADQRVLVIQRRDTGAWQLPGGVLELDESIERGVIREVHEETGLQVQPIRLTGVYKNMNLGVVALVFLARPGEGDPHPTDEATQVAWWTAEQVRKGMAEAFAVRILDALPDSNDVAIRHHDGVNLLH
ncbi:NUDIX hydrolase [Rhizocola hellebori]|uniref:NUDIX hydrolase n=1 Tax=Rhizocola hellebori TaxID=1392758 RepID=A0A8J3QGS8_9ACTN|nr:NUDIX hydrolase [Rhizocola hellebori]GIH10321.1 NUDIX hydrolase [Rhizocola hellebori]